MDPVMFMRGTKTAVPEPMVVILPNAVCNARMRRPAILHPTSSSMIVRASCSFNFNRRALPITQAI